MKPSFYKGRHLISASDLDFLTKQKIFEETVLCKELYGTTEGKNALKHLLNSDGHPKEFLLLFWEPSLRTVRKFQKAIEKMGGHETTMLHAGQVSSVAKGESIRSTVINEGWDLDCIIMRHDGKKETNALKIAADTCEEYGLKARIINAGDGAGEHPTQMLADLFTIWEYKKREFETGKLVYGFVGDLNHSRTIHSDILALQDYGAKKIYLISKESNNLPEWILNKVNLPFEKITNDAYKVAPEIDCWYFTRYQRERKGAVNDSETPTNYGEETEEELEYCGNYGVDRWLRALMKEDSIVMHPLPHGKEFPEDIDLKDKRFIHRIQARNGFFTSMALLKIMFAPKVDLKIAALEQETIKIYGEVKKFEILIKNILKICADKTCLNVYVAGGWVNVASQEKMEELRALGKPFVFCEKCALLH